MLFCLHYSGMKLLYIYLFVDQDILRFDVSVNYLISVHVVKG